MEDVAEVIPLSLELTLLGWSVLLLIVHIAVQGVLATREFGLAHNASPRDIRLDPRGLLVGRAERALKNFLETYPAFVGLSLGLALNAETGMWGTAGAITWFVARIAYLPLYTAGVVYVRSFVWLVSLAGLLMMVFALLI
jgi:uncharacterized MAPEG superfamily protein